MTLPFRTSLTIVAALGLLTGAAWSAPVPKESLVPKVADTDEAKPVEGDAAALRAHERTSSNNLKQIGIAVHTYSDVYNSKLPQSIYDKDGKALLSWRVQLLPYLEEDSLYKQFKLDEPWDSPNNLKLLEKIPAVFTSPRAKAKKGYTVYQGFFGNDAIFGSKYTIANIPDGSSNTILCVEATSAVPWSKPVDILFEPKKDLPKFGKAFDEKPLAALCDGSVRELDLKKISEATLKHAIQAGDGFALGADW